MQPANFLQIHQTRILVDRRAALGDVIMITPVLHELRRRYPEAWIQVVTREPAALANNPSVNRVVSPDDMKKEDPWDLYLNLNDAYETNITSHYVDSYLHRAFGNFADIDKTLRVYPTQDEIDSVEEAKKEIGTDYVVMHMRRFAWENKNIHPEIWSRVWTLMEGHHPDVKLVSVGAKYDFRAIGSDKRVDLNEQLSIGEIKQLIAGAKCFIGGDSGPYHIACTTDTPIVALLSHLSPEQILPWRGGEFGKDVTVVQSDVGCLGCYSRQKTIPVRALTCENEKQWACATSFDSNKMYEAVKGYL